MRIFSYYSNVNELNAEDELRLTLIWRAAWERAGFEPLILSEWHARRHPYFEEYDAAVSKLPTVNPSGYERACFLRHLALAQVGGGFCSDYDVLPRESGTDMFGCFCADKLNMFQKRGPCPSLIYASKETCERLCREFATGRLGKRDYQGREHTSDQYYLADLVTEEEAKPENDRTIVLHDYVLGYGDDGWQKARFVHFSNGSCHPRGKTPRWKHIAELMKETA